MRRILLALVLATTLTTAAAAGPFEDADAAYQRGDYATALRLWRPLAEQGNAPTQYNLGLMYSSGQGVPQDYAEAMKWCRLAVEQGYARAQYMLGIMYANGRGVPQNDVQAHMWFNLAASRAPASERDEAIKMRNVAASNMTPEQIGEAQRLAQEWKPK
jgi:TPR repeat protein